MGSHSATAAGAAPMDKTHRSAETEASIVEAARNIMAEGGYAAVSMRSVAERVGLSATAIYRYFAGKEDLIGRVVRSGYRRFGESLTEAAEHHPAGSLERLFAMSDAYVRFAFDNQEYFRVLYNIQSRPRDLEDLPGSGGMTCCGAVWWTRWRPVISARGTPTWWPTFCGPPYTDW